MRFKNEVFETAQFLNSRVNPNTSAPKMVSGRHDPVYEEGGQEDYPIHYRTQMGRKSEHGAYLKLLADRRITLRNLNPKATYSPVDSHDIRPERFAYRAAIISGDGQANGIGGR